jgi:tetratricopeptide (TPR) repeat protein
VPLDLGASAAAVLDAAVFDESAGMVAPVFSSEDSAADHGACATEERREFSCLSPHIHIRVPPHTAGGEGEGEGEKAGKGEGESEGERNRELGNERFRSGDYAGAIRFYTQAIKNNTRTSAIYANRSLAYLRANNANKALEDAHEAVKLDAQNTKVCVCMCVCVCRYFWSTTLTSISLPLPLSPSPLRLQAYHRRGAAFAALSRFQEAMRDYQKVRLGRVSPSLFLLRCSYMCVCVCMCVCATTPRSYPWTRKTSLQCLHWSRSRPP